MIWLWLVFITFVLALLALDLGLFHRKAHAVGAREALGWSAVWIATALLFTIFIYFGYENHWMGLGRAVDEVDGLTNDGRTASAKYLAGYLLEKSLSVDNLFVIATLFAAVKVRAEQQHRVLFWGILGALVLRGLMIAAGAELLEKWHWVLYVFGVFLIWTGIKMLLPGKHSGSPARMLAWARRRLPVTDAEGGGKFLVRVDRRWLLTPPALALILIEASDVVFAADSIPAVFSITADPFLVFTSNIFAVLGLRSLYFALAGLMARFRYLNISLAVLMLLIGGKMLAGAAVQRWIGPNFNWYLLGLVTLVLGAGIGASMWRSESAVQNDRIAPT